MLQLWICLAWGIVFCLISWVASGTFIIQAPVLNVSIKFAIAGLSWASSLQHRRNRYCVCYAHVSLHSLRMLPKLRILQDWSVYRVFRELLPRETVPVRGLHCFRFRIFSKIWFPCRKNFARKGPEARLYMVCFGAVLFPVSMFVYAWCAFDRPGYWVAQAIAVAVSKVRDFLLVASWLRYTGLYLGGVYHLLVCLHVPGWLVILLRILRLLQRLTRY